MLEKFARDNPQAIGVVLESHGLFTWGSDGRACYETTIATINKAIAWLAERQAALAKPVFGGASVAAEEPAARRATAAGLMVAIRGEIGKSGSKVGHFDDDPAVLEFVNSKRLQELAALGTSCPDHFLRTKIRPLVLDYAGDPQATLSGLGAAIAAFRDAYAGYYDRCKRADSPAMRDPNPVVYLVPRVGMITFAANKATARIAGEFYRNAINVMRGASTVDSYVGLPEQEAFDIEYWLLEEAKLKRMPKPKSLAGRVALVTGGANGIGRAAAAKLMAEGRGRRAGGYRRGGARRDGERLRQGLRQGQCAQRRHGRHRRSGGDRRLRRCGHRIWRPRYPGLQCRHLVGVADRGHARWRRGTATWTSWPRAISWSRARLSG